MTIKPLGKRVLAKKIEAEEKKTSGGIVLPDSVKNEKVVRAEVIAVGTDEKFEVKVGDQILVGNFTGERRLNRARTSSSWSKRTRSSLSSKPKRTKGESNHGQRSHFR